MSRTKRSGSTETRGMKMRVRQRGTPDPNGHVVDVYPRELTINVITLKACTDVDDSILLTAALDALRVIQKMPIARLRDRDFSIFFCHWEAYGEALVDIGLPSRFDHRLHRLFREQLSSVANIVELGDSLALDVGAKPFARYHHGKLVAYVDPLDTHVCDAAQESDVELRSAESADSVATRRRRTSPLPSIRANGPQRHSIETWDTVRTDILNFIWDTLEPGTFDSLRREVDRQFGIHVRVAPTALTGKHGSITTDWLIDSDQGCEVVILINKDLADKLKYVVLAHELAHYVVHFPIILAGQLVDQLAWAEPAFELAYSDLFHQYFQDGRVLEEEANSLASCMLIPPKFHLRGMADFAFENFQSVSAEELAWRFLQSFFPETSEIQYSWRNWDEMRRRAERDVEWANGVNAMNAATLYQAMPKSTLEREKRESGKPPDRTSEAVYEFWDRLPAALAARSRTITGPISDMPTLDSVNSSRQILEPRIHGRSNLSRQPIAPATKSRAPKLWRSVLDLSAPPRTVEEWQLQYPNDAITLYPDRQVPHETVYHL